MFISVLHAFTNVLVPLIYIIIMSFGDTYNISNFFLTLCFMECFHQTVLAELIVSLHYRDANS